MEVLRQQPKCMEIGTWELNAQVMIDFAIEHTFTGCGIVLLCMNHNAVQ